MVAKFYIDRTIEILGEDPDCERLVLAEDGDRLRLLEVREIDRNNKVLARISFSKERAQVFVKALVEYIEKMS